jgi:hypothetical protein
MVASRSKLAMHAGWEDTTPRAGSAVCGAGTDSPGRSSRTVAADSSSVPGIWSSRSRRRASRCGRDGTEVEEVARRLERSFDDLYAVDGYVLQGSASVGIALYPEDGTTRDSLLSAADAAMYVAKQTRRQVNELISEQPDPAVTPRDRA